MQTGVLTMFTTVTTGLNIVERLQTWTLDPVKTGPVVQKLTVFSREKNGHNVTTHRILHPIQTLRHGLNIHTTTGLRIGPTVAPT